MYSFLAGRLNEACLLCACLCTCSLTLSNLVSSDEYMSQCACVTVLVCMPRMVACMLRWLERMNSKLREQGKKEEKRRLKEFVENAYRCDPRVIAYKEAQRAER